MSRLALYTFGLLDPSMSSTAVADFSRRGGRIFGASAEAPGFLGQADGAYGAAVHEAGADFGRWGAYALPLGLPDFAGHDPNLHIATLSLWQDVQSARAFVYRGQHREALRHRYEWFIRGPWPGQVLWFVDDDVTPRWSEGVARLEALARSGESDEHFTFNSRWGRG